ncbi:hypothetical protein [Streptomyces sp. NPDC006552]|uniref:hypothetical protein n=1 Tax=Streptomyces sp. NPDC006552 TaxID=3157179 RepID=UPI0033B12AC7
MIQVGDAAHAAHRARSPQAPPRDADQAAELAEQRKAEQLLNARLDAIAAHHEVRLTQLELIST